MYTEYNRELCFKWFSVYSSRGHKPEDWQSQVSPTVCTHLSSKVFTNNCLLPACQLWRLDGKIWLSDLLWTLGRLGTSVPQPMTADVLWCASQFCSLEEQAIPHSCSTRTGSFLSVCVGAAVSNEVDKVMDPVIIRVIYPHALYTVM